MSDQLDNLNEFPSSPLYDQLVQKYGPVSGDLEVSQSPIYDTLKVAHELAISIRDSAEYSAKVFEAGRNNLVEAMGSQDSPESQEVIDSYLDREFSEFGLINTGGRHTDTSRLGRLEDQERSRLERITNILGIGKWLEYVRRGRTIER